MNQFNALSSDKPTDPPIYWNIQPPSVHFKSLASPPQMSPVVLAIMGRINQHVIDNGTVWIFPSEYPFEYTSKSVLDPYTITIKSIDYDEIDQLLQLLH